MHATTIAVLGDYARARDHRWKHPSSPAFFLSATGTRLIHTNVHKTFQDLRREASISTPPGRRRRRIHDLRHTSAVNTLIDWYRSAADVPARMPRLTTYLGHSTPASTYWYMQAAPELLTPATARLQQQEESR
jgi:integrase